MSLRTRVVALIGLVLAAGVVFGLALAGFEARRAVQAELTAGMKGGEQTVASAFEDLPRSDHAERDLRQLVGTFDGNRHVRASLLADDGTLVSASTRFENVRPTPRWFAGLMGHPPPDKRFAAPVPGGRQILLQPIADIDIAALWGQFKIIALVLAISVACSLMLAALVIGAALKPLRALSGGFVRIGQGDYSVEVDAGGPSELLDLQRGFNAMTGRLGAMSARNQALETQLLTLQDEERADIARDLHDEIGPHLFAAKVDAEIVGRLAIEGKTREITEYVSSIQKSVTHVQGLVREILGRLRPSRVTELGLNAAIADLLSFWRARAAGAAIDSQIPDDEEGLNETTKDTVYRVVQEGLSNAVRHAGAKRIAVRVERLSGNTIEVAIDDDGAAGSAPASRGFGLTGMRERVKASGGTLHIEPAGTMGGWSVLARLPIVEASSTEEAEP